jgi:DNA-binding LytR/AlgR family response regulator
MNEFVKILIVEDEMIIAADISMMLSGLGYEITGIIPRGEDALKSMEATLPDLVLMDIALKGALDGVETARIIGQTSQTPIIFLTANADDATFARAKETLPYAFISKPFQASDLQRAIELALARLAEEHSGQALVHIGGSPESPYILSDRIFVRHKGKMIKIFLQDILFAKAERSYCKIHTSGAEYLMSLPLGALEKKLASNAFLRIHRSHIINVAKIDAIGEQFAYVSIGKITLPVSEPYQAALAQRLKTI